ncbi:MAG: DDE-type integrase/transposase/recombinase [Candidatus Lokiarchaeota archaeon]|nr:DDE-type integrase/transposase/recombinase [Candidatus Lokiarchaeota archaeon]
MTEDKRIEIALFRFSIISSLMHLDEHQDKNQIIKQLSKKKYEIPNSKKTKISSKTILKYFKIYQTDGFEGLKPKRRNDINNVRSIPKDILEKLIELKKENPLRSANGVITLIKLQDKYKDIKIARRTLSRIFKNLGLNNKNKKPKKIYRRFEMDNINDLWEVDIMDGLFIKPLKKKTYLFAFIDDHSRLIPHAQFYFDEKLPRLEDCFKKAIMKRGKPKAIYADNGKIFISNHLKRICAELGIKLLNHLPYSPQSKAKIERYFYRVQTQFLIEAEGANVTTLEQLNSFFQSWLEVCYHRTQHCTTRQTPLDRFLEGMKEIKIRKIESLEEITEIFFYRQKRKVFANTGLVTLFQNHYKVNDISLLGQNVEVRYDPFDLSRIFVYDKNGCFKLISYPHSLKDKHDPNIPEENSHKESEIKASSNEFFARLKQKELEINKKESGFIDYTKIIKGVEKNDK